MKLSKFQIIAIIILCFLWFNTKSPISPERHIDLSDENLESRAVSALYVLVDDDLKTTSVKPVESSVTASNPEDEAEVVPEKEKAEGKFPRVALFTDSVNCAPCRTVEANVIKPLRTDGWLEYGWTTGDKNSVLEVIDLAKDQDAFFNMVEKYSKLAPEKLQNKIDGRTPTFVKFNKKGEIVKVVVGPISLKEFIDLHNKDNN